jgi:hypothetical protein
MNLIPLCVLFISGQLTLAFIDLVLLDFFILNASVLPFMMLLIFFLWSIIQCSTLMFQLCLLCCWPTLSSPILIIHFQIWWIYNQLNLLVRFPSYFFHHHYFVIIYEDFKFNFIPRSYYTTNFYLYAFTTLEYSIIYFSKLKLLIHWVYFPNLPSFLSPVFMALLYLFIWIRTFSQVL